EGGSMGGEERGGGGEEAMVRNRMGCRGGEPHRRAAPAVGENDRAPGATRALTLKIGDELDARHPSPPARGLAPRRGGGTRIPSRRAFGDFAGDHVAYPYKREVDAEGRLHRIHHVNQCLIADAGLAVAL